MAYSERKNWSDMFLNDIKMKLGLHLFQTAPYAEDRERNTDLMVLTGDVGRIACRVRRSKFYEHYGDEFTVRNTAGIHQSEYQKILDGWGDIMFYGFCDAFEGFVEHYVIIDLNVFRQAENGIVADKKDNGFGDSGFKAFKFHSFPPDLIIAKSNGMDKKVERKGLFL